ncbi:MAG: anaerobic ribonucleoside-triphosphate reductase activating protein [Nanoarchaeota archaeon]|nr:anaerobic ribonucleoside-triphosphate reductase activating protein [Nanoarchaeota archaeon]
MLSNIKSIQKTSLIDYPDKVSCVIFLGGCDFRCGFCHNPDLVLGDLKSISEEEVLKFLEKKKKWLDGVVFSGGEPLLNKDIVGFIKRIKNMGFLIKVDTNGNNPKLLKELIDKKLVDYIAMDFKNSFKKYEETINVKVDINKIKESIELIKNSGVEHEFRCTILPKLHTKRDILEMCNLIKGNKFILQRFNNKVRLLNPDFQKYEQFSKEELEDFKKECDKIVECSIRF